MYRKPETELFQMQVQVVPHLPCPTVQDLAAVSSTGPSIGPSRIPTTALPTSIPAATTFDSTLVPAFTPGVSAAASLNSALPTNRTGWVRG